MFKSVQQEVTIPSKILADMRDMGTRLKEANPRVIWEDVEVKSKHGFLGWGKDQVATLDGSLWVGKHNQQSNFPQRTLVNVFIDYSAAKNSFTVRSKVHLPRRGPWSFSTSRNGKKENISGPDAEKLALQVLTI